MPISNLFPDLEVEGANGQAVPYLGYVEIDVKFPKVLFKTEPSIPTLALVVPGLRSNSDPPLLIGTNTLDPLYEQYGEELSADLESFLYGYRQILKTLRVRKHQAHSGMVGLVKLRGKSQEVLPANEKVVLEGFVHARRAEPEQWVIIESPSCSSLPGGVFVDSCLITLPKHGHYKVPILLRNETGHDITLSTNCIIAEMAAVDHVVPHPETPEHIVPGTSVSCSVQQQSTGKKPTLNFDFGSSPIPEEWKHRISQKLSTFSDVFSHHDLDFGHATKVKYHIKLKDETPFKQRSRPIHPHDFDAVKKHLKMLLDANIIRESESPFSSPVVVVRKKNGDVRLCIDYRKLNLQTIRDAYALPKQNLSRRPQQHLENDMVSEEECQRIEMFKSYLFSSLFIDQRH